MTCLAKKGNPRDKKVPLMMGRPAFSFENAAGTYSSYYCVSRRFPRRTSFALEVVAVIAEKDDAQSELPRNMNHFQEEDSV